MQSTSTGTDIQYAIMFRLHVSTTIDEHYEPSFGPFFGQKNLLEAEK